MSGDLRYCMCDRPNGCGQGWQIQELKRGKWLTVLWYDGLCFVDHLGYSGVREPEKEERKDD